MFTGGIKQLDAILKYCIWKIQQSKKREDIAYGHLNLKRG